jgi:hypothetical protein
LDEDGEGGWTWNTGAQSVTVRNSSTWLARGAPPETMNLTLPPKACLKVLKSSLSRRGVAYKTKELVTES